jgi:hypothetical protein
MTTIPKEKDVFAFASRNYNFRYVPLFEYISLNPWLFLTIMSYNGFLYLIENILQQ